MPQYISLSRYQRQLDKTRQWLLNVSSSLKRYGAKPHLILKFSVELLVQVFRDTCGRELRSVLFHKDIHIQGRKKVDVMAEMALSITFNPNPLTRSKYVTCILCARLTCVVAVLASLKKNAVKTFF